MRHLKHILLLVVAIFMVTTSSYANQLLNGIVVDGSGKGIKGVKVWTNSSRQYTKSDGKGRFGLSSVTPTDIVHIEYKKLQYDFTLSGNRGVRIVITDSKVIADPDEQLVSYGYGWVKRREYNSASSGISGDRLRATGQNSVLAALEGLVPGLYVSPSGKVTMRGRTSLTLDDQPLFIVDGIYVSSFDMINMGSIDRVEVLKDGSMYGTLGVNGAIIVYTKH